MTRIFFIAGLLLASLFSSVKKDNNDHNPNKTLTVVEKHNLQP